MSNIKRVSLPIEVLHNCRGKPVSIELFTGETFNGTVMRTDRTMNVVLKQCIRTSANGDAFWRSRECLVRGASIRNIRMDDSVLRVSASIPHKKEAARKRPRTTPQAGSAPTKIERKAHQGRTK
ncbi:unnamed protein product [Phytomonas sp. Hart1]|nr:unnamed protein product [Phytomonas sp. Hart1]|eukprot:CCW70573.1 unnamed protein product [Phytomonas sp. isolate Hart1]